VVPPELGTVYAHEGQWLNTPVTAELANGQRVEILCTIQGGLVSANNLSSTLWDKIERGFVPDVLVSTGTNQPTMPNCV
jgi:hypothetical protein